MSTAQLIVLCTGIIMLLLSIIGYFVNRTLNGIKERQDHLDICVDSLKNKALSKADFDANRTHFTDNFQTVFKEQASMGKILATLEERTRGDDRLVAVMETIRMTLQSLDAKKTRR